MKVVVTGTLYGLGLSISREIIRRGGYVIAVYVGEPSEDLLLLQKENAEQIQLVQMDLLDTSSVLSGLQKIVDHHEKIDGIINNAGIFIGRDDTIETVKLDDIRKTMEINVYSPILIIQTLLPLLRKGTNSSIVNISSSAACLIGTRDCDYSYCISKISLNMVTEKVRKYLEKENIRCVAVHPGWMNTKGGGGAEVSAPTSPENSARAIVDILTGELPVNAVPAFVDRYGKPVLQRNEIET
jgi:NAD(P)-dependent dehydrogenase (short-subunit alcohol dehydrogenase family)